MTTNHLLKIVSAISFQLIVLGMELVLRLVVFAFTLFGHLKQTRASFKSKPIWQK